MILTLIRKHPMVVVIVAGLVALLAVLLSMINGGLLRTQVSSEEETNSSIPMETESAGLEDGSFLEQLDAQITDLPTRDQLRYRTPMPSFSPQATSGEFIDSEDGIVVGGDYDSSDFEESEGLFDFLANYFDFEDSSSTPSPAHTASPSNSSSPNSGDEDDIVIDD